LRNVYTKAERQTGEIDMTDDQIRALAKQAGAQPVPTLDDIKHAAKSVGLEFERFSYGGTNQLVDFVAVLETEKDRP
jgi:hypothetical protein